MVWMMVDLVNHHEPQHEEEAPLYFIHLLSTRSISFSCKILSNLGQSYVPKRGLSLIQILRILIHSEFRSRSSSDLWSLAMICNPFDQ